jgi:cytochrome b6-f complex iron-sulfur subunit
MKVKKKHQKQRDKPVPRRRLLLKIWIGLVAVALGEIAWAVVSFLRPHSVDPDEDKTAAIMDAGRTSAFTPNSVTAFPRGQFYLICLEDGGFLALSRRCTHLGCTVPWLAEKQQFICPCHASLFDIHGDVIQSPAPRPLDTFAVTIENDRVKVDTTKKEQRNVFHKKQVVYPEPV